MMNEIGDLSNYRRVTRVAATKYFIYAEKDENVTVNVTDGVNLWQDIIDPKVLSSEVNFKKYMDALKDDFHEMVLMPSYQNNSTKIQLLSEKHEVALIGNQVADECARPVIQKLFFSFLEENLNRRASEKTVSAVNAEKVGNSPKKAGMSMVNPASRKRKAAKGVVYDE